MTLFRRLDAIGIAQILLVAGCVAALLATLYYLQDYQAYVARLERNIAEKQKTLDKLEDRTARLSSSTNVAQTALTDMQSVISQSRNACTSANALRDELRGIASKLESEHKNGAADLLTFSLAVCASPDSAVGVATAKAVEIYSEAVSARLSDDYPTAFAKYRQATTVEGYAAIDPQWKMRIDEGLGYSSLQLGRPADAARYFKDALAIDQRFVFARIGQIKLRCITHAPASEIRSAVATLSTELKQREASSPPDEKIYRHLDVTYVENDGELRRVCRYAGL